MYNRAVTGEFKSFESAFGKNKSIIKVDKRTASDDDNNRRKKLFLSFKSTYKNEKINERLTGVFWVCFQNKSR